MDYSLRKACRMIWLNKGIYLLLLIEVAIGMFLFSYCLNTTMSCDDTVRKIDEGIGTDAVQLVCYMSGTTYQPDGFSVSADMIEWLRNQTDAEGLIIQYLPYVQNMLSFADTEENAEIYLLFADEKSAATLGVSAIPKEGYIGSGAAAHLQHYNSLSTQDNYFTFWLSSLTLSESTLAFGDEWNCSLDLLLPMDSDLEKQTISFSYGSVSTEEQISLSDCIVLPLEQMGALAHAQGLSGQTVVQIFLEDWSGNWKLFIDFVKKLKDANADYNYSLTQQSVELHDGAEDIMIPYRLSLWVGISVLAITTSGMIGIFILILHKREKTNAVSVACGATYGRLFTELLTETGSVILTGTCIGLICSVPAVLRIQIAVLAMKGTIHVEAVLCSLGIAALSTLSICGIATLIVSGRQLAEVLKAS
ncbi:MAG: hypothetical protein K2I22_09465 [Lachnospiraceae bacterium]|nr:hypothetical protein [Lachnospiraceae bacterium]